MSSDLEEVQLFVRGPVVVFKWRNASGWPVEYVSPNSVDTFGYTPREFLDGDVSYAEIIHPDDLDRVASEVSSAVAGDELSFEHEPYRIIHRDGSVRWLYDVTHLVRRGGETTHFVGYVIDITKRIEAEQEARSLEHQLLASQRLESLGMLAGGVAHDFNNILTGILGEANLTRRSLSRNRNDDVLPSVERIERLALRAADLTRQLLAYSGKGRFVVLPLDLTEIVDDLASMLGVVVSKKATLELLLDPDLPAIEADRAQLQQIIMNLIQNASDALGTDAGTITIRTSVETHDAESLAGAFNSENVEAGTFVKLEVCDTGCGMSEEVLTHLFEPFFTTKENGRGLGMSAIHGIIRSHGGAIQVESSPGTGTRFELFFPATDQPAVAVRESQATESWVGRGTALVVDDEDAVRRVATQMLERLGFETLTARDGAEALDLLETHADIDLVLLDMMMPVKGGAETMEDLRRRWPDLPVIMTSGFDVSDVTSRLSGLPATTFLQKPYRLPDLQAALRAVGAPGRDESASAAG